GHIPGVVPGTTWRSRAEISQAGVHGGYQSGISASKNDQGAASIVMNGFYANSDGGDLVWYIGAGGKHLGGKDYKKMIKNQTINTSYNKAMCQSLITGQPVRLVRGSKMKKNSPWAPDEGFRYDGLYVVTRSDQ
ncbi:PUA-like domain-containing protein, partial [Phakopsora pachyrhizi]